MEPINPLPFYLPQFSPFLFSCPTSTAVPMHLCFCKQGVHAILKVCSPRPKGSIAWPMGGQHCTARVMEGGSSTMGAWD